MRLSIRFTKTFAAFAALLLSSGYVAFAQQPAPPHHIHLKNTVVAATGNLTTWISETEQHNEARPPQQVLIHFSRLPADAEKKQLQQSGITLLDYIADNSFSALVQTPVNTAMIMALPVHSITAMQPEWKADDYLWKKVSSGNGAIQLLVSVSPGITAAALAEFITTLGGQLDLSPMAQAGAYKISVAARQVRALAQWYGSRYISPVTGMVPLDLQSRPAVKGNVAVSSRVYGGYELTGDSVTVGVGDNSSGIHHVDMEGRITNFNPVSLSHHGAIVNGIVGASAVVDPLAAVTTPHVQLIDYLYDQILSATGAMNRGYNMTITNNSYSLIAGDCSYAGIYDIYSQFVDSMSFKYPNVQHVFASGNDGTNNCSPYLPGFSTVAGGFQPAKNNIVVGSITDLFEQASDESRGPVRDGRLKPDITAIGLGSYSTIAEDQYAWSAGTSMASPQVAGGLAALTQHYKRLNGNAQPRADLLKAILLNGAMDLGNPGPDFTYGFGAMDLARSLKIIDGSNFSANDLANGDSQTISISVPPNTAQLKVMLYWNDVPASPTASKQLLNDLDLTVKDPGNTVHLPWGPNPLPANVNDPSTEHADHINNTEQVTITNPAAGSFAITAKGFSVPFGPQHYVITYDIIPKGTYLTYPLGGEQLSNFDSIRIFWNTVSDGNPFTVQYSTDNGGSWNTIANNVAANVRHCDFLPTNISSGNCLVRVLRNNTGEVAVSSRFAITPQTKVIPDTAQCPGYVNIHWSPIPNASKYYVLKKTGLYMQVADSTADTTYIFSGMSLTAKSYVAAQPIVDGLPGYRSIAVSTIASSGNCSLSFSNGDLTVEKVISPTNGRMYTSTQLTAATPVKVQVRTLYSAPCNNYVLYYQVNGGTWQSLTTPAAIPGNGTAIVTLTGIPFAAPGSYNIRVAILNTDFFDPQPFNDTLAFTLLSIANDPISLSPPFFDGFETMGRTEITHDSIGVSPNGHWDFANSNDYGRMRSFVNDDITITGDRSISLDATENISGGVKNNFTGTFNLSGYDTANTEVRMDFDYVLHGTPKTSDGNWVSVRAADTLAWDKLYTYNLAAYPGYLTHVASLSLTDAVRTKKKNFSTSCQVSFGQNDTSLIATISYGNGMTFDNFRLYTVVNDAQMVGIISPQTVNCGLSASSPLTVQVRNGVNNTLYNVQLFYTLDGGTTYTGIIDSIKPKATINYTFAQTVTLAAGTTHAINVWLSGPGDSYTANDSILNFHTRNSQLISTFPYLENFEAGDGGFFTDGQRSSWRYGTPASPKINKAASGTRAWKTNLTGIYNNLENSYLYSPCFDISRLDNPMFSFSEALDIENCGSALCDAAWLEYSFDGSLWHKLGAPGQGTNWYDSTFSVWNTAGFTRWHVASIAIPQLGSGQSTRFRFVFTSDPGVTREGIAIDDIHIYDRVNTIYPASGATTISHDLAANQWQQYLQDNQLVAAIKPRNQDISSAAVTLYAHDTLYNAGGTQYTFPRSYTIKAAQAPADSATIKLYLLESDMVKVLKDTTCPACAPVKDAYSLGVTEYTNTDHSDLENNSLADDTGGAFHFYPPRAVTWVPYDKGYIATLAVKPFSEFWFNNGGPAGNFPANADYLNFIAYRTGDSVTTSWYSLIDTAVDVYTVQRSADSIIFSDRSAFNAKHTDPAAYNYIDSVDLTASAAWYYRLKWTMTGKDDKYYSAVRKVSRSDSASGLVSFDARMTGNQNVLASWTSYIDGVADHYTLERAIGSHPFTTISTTAAAHLYGRQYAYSDHPSEGIASGVPVHYRLTAVLEDGTNIVLPEKIVRWVEGNTIANIYPNPTHDGAFNIDWYADAGTTMHMNMTNAVGESVFQGSAVATQWSNTASFHAVSFAKGLYFVRLDIGGKRMTAKLVFQ